MIDDMYNLFPSTLTGSKLKNWVDAHIQRYTKSNLYSNCLIHSFANQSLDDIWIITNMEHDTPQHDSGYFGPLQANTITLSEFNFSLVFITDPEGINQLELRCKTYKRFALDCLYKGKKQISLIQIATAEAIFLFHIPENNASMREMFAQALARLLSTKKMRIIGFNCKDKIQLIMKRFSNKAIPRESFEVIEFRHTLRILSEKLLQKKTCIGELKSDWDRIPLSSTQVHFAALNAYLPLRLFEMVIDMSLSKQKGYLMKIEIYEREELLKKKEEQTNAQNIKNQNSQESEKEKHKEPNPTTNTPNKSSTPQEQPNKNPTKIEIQPPKQFNNQHAQKKVNPQPANKKPETTTTQKQQRPLLFAEKNHQCTPEIVSAGQAFRNLILHTTIIFGRLLVNNLPQKYEEIKKHLERFMKLISEYTDKSDLKITQVTPPTY